VDLSAVIFVVLAVAWAVYLIPKALKHHDELASDRLVEGHSDRVRILSRRSRKAPGVEAETAAAEPPVVEPVVEPALPTRATARRAARNRRRVLAALLVVLAVVWTLTWFAYLPIWAPGVPGALCVAWLVVARLSVRAQQQRRRRASTVQRVEIPVRAPMVEPFETPLSTPAQGRDLVDLLIQDPTPAERERVEAALADDGSLWDPLPLTLPTYVNKARARRTVRTIELTGISSSGHDEADTAMAREAETAAASAEQADAERKVAGA